MLAKRLVTALKYGAKEAPTSSGLINMSWWFLEKVMVVKPNSHWAGSLRERVSRPVHQNYTPACQSIELNCRGISCNKEEPSLSCSPVLQTTPGGLSSRSTGIALSCPALHPVTQTSCKTGRTQAVVIWFLGDSQLQRPDIFLRPNTYLSRVHFFGYSTTHPLAEFLNHRNNTLQPPNMVLL